MKDQESLPPAYGESVLMALVQGPGVVYVYWELAPALWRLFAGDGPVLRLFEVRGKKIVMRAETVLDESTGHRYFGVAPGRTYRAALGLRRRDTFYPYLYSPRVATPPVEMSAGDGRPAAKPFKVLHRVGYPGSSGFGPGGRSR